MPWAAPALRAAGLTGKGVTVAVVDSGCDASHPDLADHVAHNVKLYSTEYANLAPDSSNTIVVANETGPYQNTDVGSGHGTHVAGIIAADSTTAPDGSRYGVAPDAELVCYSIGEVLFTTAVVTAYDHMLDQPDMWGVDVVNNSWGNSFRQFDPRDPVAVVTKAVADLGVTVVFAAGNSGAGEVEMSLNPFSQSPWVISVAAGTLDHHRGDFSSNGLAYDNSDRLRRRRRRAHRLHRRPDRYLPSRCHRPRRRHQLDLRYGRHGHRSVPAPDYGNATASGTSMASPHVAGAAAVLLQANPNLTPDQVRQAHAGHRHAGRRGRRQRAPVLAGRVRLRQPRRGGRAWRRPRNMAKELGRGAGQGRHPRPRRRDTVARATSGRTTRRGRRSPAPTRGPSRPPSAIGTTHVKVTLAHPSLGRGVLQRHQLRRDGARRGGPGARHDHRGDRGRRGTASLLRRSAAPPRSRRSYGTFTFEVVGNYAASDPDTFDSESLLGRMVTLQVAQLVKTT